MPPDGSYQTLVLNADYRPVSYFPLSICSWQDAIKAIVLERVHVLAEYNRAVRSPSLELRIPSVVSLKHFIASDRSVPPFTRYNVYLRDRFTCQYCGCRFEQHRLSLDHVIPKSKGGVNTWEN